MRVLHLGKYYPPYQGGVETVTFELVEGVNRLGMAVDVLCFNPGGGRLEEVRQAGGDGPPYRVTRAATPLVAASTPLSADFARLLARMAGDYDILHLHCPNPMAALALRLVNPRTRVLLHWHSDVVRQKRLNAAYRLLLGNWLARRADAVLGATPAHLEASEYAEAFRDKGRVIPFCLDPTPFAPERVDQAVLEGLRMRFPGRKAVFALGRLISYKGFEVLVRAAALLPPEWVALIGGTGPLEGRLRGLVRDLGLAGRVILLGAIDQEALSAHYAFCRVFCLPSLTRAEMYGMVQLEAMASGRPVVSTRIPGSGVTDVNRHGVTGLTVEPGDPAALAGAILEADADQARWQAMSLAGLAAARERFSPQVVLGRVAQLYREMAGQETRP